MASLGIRCGGNCGVLDRRYVNVNDGCDQNPGPRSLAVSSTGRFTKSKSLVSAMKSLQPVNHRYVNARKTGRDQAISRDELDRWMHESVVDIVKNLQAAPLFLRFYTTEDGETAKFQTEKAMEEDRWRILANQWKSGATAAPEGIIFVQELEDEDSDGKIEGKSKAWGIVVQGRCVEAPVCYLLKTNRTAGVGAWCTHFCLVRVKNFRERTKSQLENRWLVQNQ